jgi:hypothetical protein
MEPFVIILVPGLLGGIAFAVLFYQFARRPPDGVTVAERLEPPSTGIINMAQIRVAGIGGLGMVAMSIVVAIFVPRIRFTMALGIVLGCVMAAILVAVRRRNDEAGAGIDPGAHALFPLDVPSRRAKNNEARGATADARDLGLPIVGADQLRRVAI